MDQKDSKILEILKKDGRTSYTDIAEQIEVSEGTVRNRVERMKSDGKIERFTVDISEEGLSAIVMIKVSTDADLDKIISSLPDSEYHEVTGDYDMILKFSRASFEQLNSDLDSIRAIDGVEETKTYSVLESGKA